MGVRSSNLTFIVACANARVNEWEGCAEDRGMDDVLNTLHEGRDLYYNYLAHGLQHRISTAVLHQKIFPKFKNVHRG